jgi:RNA-directed DNA polymerase
MPPPVRAAEIPKRDGSPRILGVPTVADRIAQTVVRGYLEPGVEPYFHPDSYGYRPGRSALDAVGVCRERCWRQDCVLDLDLKSFFDSVPWDLVLKAVPRCRVEPPRHDGRLAPGLASDACSNRRLRRLATA